MFGVEAGLEMPFSSHCGYQRRSMSAGSKLLASSIGDRGKMFGKPTIIPDQQTSPATPGAYFSPVSGSSSGSRSCSRRATKSLIASLAMSGMPRRRSASSTAETGFNQRWQFGGRRRSSEWANSDASRLASSRRTCRAGRLWSGVGKYFLGQDRDILVIRCRSFIDKQRDIIFPSSGSAGVGDEGTPTAHQRISPETMSSALIRLSPRGRASGFRSRGPCRT